jgi:acetyl esterase/lipase
MKRSCFLALLVVSISAGNTLSQDAKPNPLAQADVKKNLVYGTHERNKLDLAVPQGDGPFPLIVWIHGGGWEGGNKDGFGPLVAQLSRGYAIATINYRYSRHAKFPAQIIDSKAAIRFLRTHAKEYKLDADHFGVCGASAGGHLSALLGTSNGVAGLDEKNAKPEECRVQAVVNYFGPADLMKLSPPGSKESAVTRLLGGNTGEKGELAKLGSPQTHADKMDPPMLLVHGDSDKLVPLSQSEDLLVALKAAGIESDLIVVKGVGHDAGVFKKETNDRVNEFWDKHLKKK